ncbi:MAG: hypothetical protein A3C79_02340 [Candidatus Taylorbacteria bacterium RIFCSPHIGHO2_02_FULL_45_28]|uniref:Uncharacterized protein n=1 Tax=Candidatus Taylorbacteria bacterium RIFCSPHIGHO2_12_FULL_45_16 TaxID=1802315 RepID=A0A1G2N0F4_9BACT|nr:MAG: hypothetical protein A2830_03150 [Candidatus Taylorbacteria bacterium RIFCSPHIGHO2_01_FULL_44_110]OHA25294.1 MAG: hypothetical protein A3C79_02340 [Candidatus Taylorbacteria bacterium RIFCSPHIGHO2_02_FULL_45_28]OHA28681.1 MAG: hypothetical protein A3F51_02810 [Candidatus Taylorbacteria bacterium RIFCSPHIGHO2_12_FULL_45_16]OHA32954.1 MAG: hypothetical protein A3A23_00985 [Candidatus Taylorbacteria bacterium RIFCSPLOWO2_01_FULL_45_59]OHA38443.1 MAG: hypothetical protein A3I98_00485 [Candi
MSNQYELIFIFASVIIGVVSASYFYISAGVFDRLNLLQRPLKWIAAGMFIIAIGVLMAAFISYEAKLGFELIFYGLPLQVLFYILYIIGSLMILIGARRFTHRSLKDNVVDVSLQSR